MARKDGRQKLAEQGVQTSNLYNINPYLRVHSLLIWSILCYC